MQDDADVCLHIVEERSLLASAGILSQYVTVTVKVAVTVTVKVTDQRYGQQSRLRGVKGCEGLPGAVPPPRP